MSYQLNLGFSVGEAGLTLRGQLYDVTTTPGTLTASGAEITTGIIDLGDGNYAYLATLPDDFDGVMQVYEVGEAASPLATCVIASVERPVPADAAPNGLVFDDGPGSGEDDPFTPYTGYDGYPSYVREVLTHTLYVFRDTANSQWALAESQGGAALYTRQGLSPLGDWTVVEQTAVPDPVGPDAGGPTVTTNLGGSGYWSEGESLAVTVYSYKATLGQTAYSPNPISGGGGVEAETADTTMQITWEAPLSGSVDGYLLHITGTSGAGAVDAWIDVGDVLTYECVGDEGTTAATDVSETSLPYPATITASPRRVPADIADTTEATRIGTIDTNAAAAALAAAAAQTAAESVDAKGTTMLARLGAWTGTGVNTILGAFKWLLGKSASTVSDIGGTYQPASDSLEALGEQTTKYPVNVNPNVAFMSGVQQQDIQCTVFRNGTLPLMARVYGNDGNVLTQAAVTSIAYSVYLLDERDKDSRTVVSGHSAASVTVASAIFDTLQTDEFWTADTTGYNFKHRPSIATNDIFTVAGRKYLVEYTITLTSGERIRVRFRVNVI